MADRGSQDLASQHGEVLRTRGIEGPLEQAGPRVEEILARHSQADVAAGARVIGDAGGALQRPWFRSHGPQHEADRQLPAVAKPRGVNPKPVKAVEQRGVAFVANHGLEVPRGPFDYSGDRSREGTFIEDANLRDRQTAGGSGR